MTFWILLCYVAIVLFTLSSCDPADSSRPLIIALPIRIQATRPSFPMPQEDREQEESEEEQPREQRIVQRTYNPNHDEPRYPQQENSNIFSQSDFLTWNPANKFMVLQINDFIGGRNEDSSESEETEKMEEPGMVKPGQNWPYQGGFDFETARIPGLDNKEEQLTFRNPSATKKKKKNAENYSVEDTEGSDVYGTDPVMHFLRNRSKKNGGPFDFSEIPPEDDDEFGNWWRY